MQEAAVSHESMTRKLCWLHFCFLRLLWFSFTVNCKQSDIGGFVVNEIFSGLLIYLRAIVIVSSSIIIVCRPCFPLSLTRGNSAGAAQRKNSKEINSEKKSTPF